MPCCPSKLLSGTLAWPWSSASEGVPPTRRGGLVTWDFHGHRALSWILVPEPPLAPHIAFPKAKPTPCYCGGHLGGIRKAKGLREREREMQKEQMRIQRESVRASSSKNVQEFLSLACRKSTPFPGPRRYIPG